MPPLIAIGLVLAATADFPDWRHPAWGSSPADVAGALGPDFKREGGEVRSDVVGMDEKVRGRFVYGPYAVYAKFFFQSYRLTLITFKLDRPESCPDLDFQFASRLGKPVLYEHMAGGGFVDAWDSPRSRDRWVLSGGAGKAAYCDLTIGPPRRDRFNTQ